MPAVVKVFVRSIVTTDNIATAIDSVVYQGVARVQPTGGTSRNPEAGDTEVKQPVRFQVELNSVGFVADKMLCQVVECDLNPALVSDTIYSLQEVVDSSNPIIRTFNAVVDASG